MDESTGLQKGTGLSLLAEAITESEGKECEGQDRESRKASSKLWSPA